MAGKTRFFPAVAAALVMFAGASTSLAQELSKDEKREVALSSLTLDPRDETNAALHYYRLIAGNFGDAAKLVAERRDTDEWIPDAETSTALENEQGNITSLIRASKLKECSWGSPYYTDGFGVLLPALGKMRAGARMLSADARRLASQGESRQAAERLAALYRIGDHVSRENVLIGSLVGIAISALTDGDVKFLTSKGWLDGESKALVAAAAAQARASDFHMKDAIEMERTIVSEWFRRVVRGPDGKSKLREFIDQGDGNDTAVEALLNMSTAELDKQIDEASKFYDDAITAFYQPDGEALLRTLSQDVEGGRYGLLATVVCPAFNKCHTSWSKGMAGLDESIKLLGGAPATATGATASEMKKK